jgi:predicted NAD-dependent protein-ADP-ribosyltransferase YbiA (DUF1768 family)
MGNMCQFWDGEPLNPIPFAGKEFKTSEHLFQALRFWDRPELVNRILRAGNAYHAKKEKNKIMEKEGHLPKNGLLSSHDVLAMVNCVHLKLKYNPKLLDLLLETKGQRIVEDVSSRRGGSGLFWGAAKVGEHWIGFNVLGRIWELMRSEAMNEEATLGSISSIKFIKYIICIENNIE